LGATGRKPVRPVPGWGQAARFKDENGLVVPIFDQRGGALLPRARVSACAAARTHCTHCMSGSCTHPPETKRVHSVLGAPACPFIDLHLAWG
jgi:hypothetical protein